MMKYCTIKKIEVTFLTSFLKLTHLSLNTHHKTCNFCVQECVSLYALAVIFVF